MSKRAVVAVMSLVLLASVAFSASAQFAPLTPVQCGILGIKCQGAADTAAVLAEYLWAIVNVFLAVVAVIAFAYIVYGGLKYIMSGGDESAAAAGKKAVLYAVIGLIIIGIATVIVNFTMSAIGVKSNLPGSSDLPGVLWTIINVFLGLVGVIALIFVVIGGVKYITSAGDEKQAEEGKNAVKYAVIGLVVIGLATILINFVFGVVGLPFPLPGDANLPVAIWLVANAFLTLVGIIGLIFVVIGGVKYITSQGDESDVGEAKKTILYSIIGLLVIGISAAIVNFVLSAV